MLLESENVFMQLFIGASLGLLWLPCVGPTLGTAIAFAAMGEDLMMAFVVMFSFGVGTALPLIAFGFITQESLKSIEITGKTTKKWMGVSFLIVSVFVLTELDRELEIFAMKVMPTWSVDI